MARGPGGLYELTVKPTDERLYNEDLAPTRIAARTWVEGGAALPSGATPGARKC